MKAMFSEILPTLKDINIIEKNEDRVPICKGKKSWLALINGSVGFIEKTLSHSTSSLMIELISSLCLSDFKYPHMANDITDDEVILENQLSAVKRLCQSYRQKA